MSKGNIGQQQARQIMRATIRELARQHRENISAKARAIVAARPTKAA